MKSRINWQDDFRQSVDIILASYNGDKYIRDQIVSLQECDGYEALVKNIIVVDDGSNDLTLSIVGDMAKLDSKIQIFPSDGRSLGAMRNFCRGASLSRAEFVMFCDQDDVWLKEKLEMTLLAMGERSCPIPKLVFSDVVVVDEMLGVISESYFALKRIPKNWYSSVNSLIKQNVVSGCTMMANRALIARALPVEASAYMHDWWLALVASAEGELIFVDKPLMLYRQHNSNAIGAVLARRYDFFYRLRRFVSSVDKTVLQARAFRRMFPRASELSPAVEALSQITDRTVFTNVGSALCGELRRSSLLGCFAMAMYCMVFAKNIEKRNQA
ncbi:glycosyltransferase family 2 protein [Enterovibrio norvegicus]|uniref:glycosyltransferase family 2 protein n=1 Tax=Enterovibrio norvegicus TaxID=188144 RepID=UPI00352D9212